MSLLYSSNVALGTAGTKEQPYLRYMGQVQKYSDLPKDAKPGEVYDVVETGANYAWNGKTWDKMSEVETLPKQAGNAGKFLTTDGSQASWSNIDQTKITFRQW